MEQWTRGQIMKGLQKLVTEMDFMKTSEEHDYVFPIPNGKKGRIWTIGARSGYHL